MSEIAGIAATIFKRLAGRKRILVAIAGAPAAGKSTMSEKLARLLPEGSAVVVPMDGFHYDDIVLEARGLRPRKGAPETFDFAGFKVLLTPHPQQRTRHRHPGLRPHDRTVARGRRHHSAVTSSSSSSRATTCSWTKRRGRNWRRSSTTRSMSTYRARNSSGG